MYELESVNMLMWITQIIWISQPLRLAKLDFTVRLLVLVAKVDSMVRPLLNSDSTDNVRFYGSLLSLCWLLYLVVNLRTCPYCILVYSVLGEVISYVLPDSAYPAMWYPT